MHHLEQVALGIVLLRYQREQERHFHWEQPQSSLMFKLPYLSELYHYTRAIDVDMRTAGNLRDPENGKPIKKGLTIMSTSEKFAQSMQGLRCPGNHDHQVIEGSVVVDGQRLNRSAYTERYPRRVCRGTNRTIGPPNDLVIGEAPSFRKGFYQERHVDRISTDTEWDSWEQMSQRQLIRPSPACRINITFAANPTPETAVPAEEPSKEMAECPEALQPRSNPGTSPEEMSMSKSQLADLRNHQQPLSFRQLPKNEQASILSARRNLGHPSAEKLSTIMRQEGFRSEVVRAAAEMRCSVCESTAEPKHARPSVLRDDLDFNDRISIDGFRWTNSQGKSFHVYHVIDWATSFHISCVAPSRTSEDIINSLINMWFQWAGSPSELIVDAASEFNSQEFMQFVQAHNIRLTTISPEAHFQNSKSERHGAILQKMLSKFDLEHPINSYQNLQRSLWFCN